MGGTYDHDENGELNGRVTDRARDVFNNVGKRETFTAEQKEQRERDGLGLHLQTIRSLWPDQRPPRRRQFIYAPAGAGPRRTAASRELRN